VTRGDESLALVSRLRAISETPAGRLRLVLGYAAGGMAVRAAFLLGGPPDPTPNLLRDVVSLAIKTALSVLVPVVFLRCVRPDTEILRAFRLRLEGSAGGVGRGAAAAAAFFAVIYSLASLQEGHPQRIVLPPWPFATVGLLHVLVEELGTRGFVLTWLSEGRSFARANLIASGLFVALHWPFFLVSGMGWLLLPASVVLFTLSLVLGWATKRSGSIWIAVVLHAANNALAGP
jgi:membrane protease YdiL (CAAX protease family)